MVKPSPRAVSGEAHPNHDARTVTSFDERPGPAFPVSLRAALYLDGAAASAGVPAGYSECPVGRPVPGHTATARARQCSTTPAAAGTRSLAGSGQGATIVVDVDQGDDGGEGAQQGLERVFGTKRDRVGDGPVRDMGCCRGDP